MPAGRPTEYKPEYCDRIVEYMANGYSYASFAAEVGVCYDTINEWANVHPEFSVAKKIANAKRIKWWETNAIARADGLIQSKGGESTCIFMLKNCAPELYKDRHEDDNKQNADGKILEGCSTETLSLIARDLANK